MAFDPTRDPWVQDPQIETWLINAYIEWYRSNWGVDPADDLATFWSDPGTTPELKRQLYRSAASARVKEVADTISSKAGSGTHRVVREKKWKPAQQVPILDGSGNPIPDLDSSGVQKTNPDGSLKWKTRSEPAHYEETEKLEPLTPDQIILNARNLEAQLRLYDMEDLAAPLMSAQIEAEKNRLAEEEAIRAATSTERQELGKRQVELAGQEIKGDIQEQQVRQMALKDAQDAYKFAKVERIAKPFIDLAGNVLKDTAEGVSGLAATVAGGVSNLGKGALLRGSQTLGAGQRDQSTFLAPQFNPIPSNLHESVTSTTPAARAVVPTVRNIPAAKLMGQGSTAAGNMMVAKSPAGKLLAPSLKNSPAGQAMMPQMQATTEIDMSGITAAGALPRIGFSRKKKIKKNTYNQQMSAVRRQF